MWEENGIAWVNFALALYPKGNQDSGERWVSLTLHSKVDQDL